MPAELDGRRAIADMLTATDASMHQRLTTVIPVISDCTPLGKEGPVISCEPNKREGT